MENNNNILGAAMRQLILLSHVVQLVRQAATATTITEINTIFCVSCYSRAFPSEDLYLIERDALALLYRWELLPASLLCHTSYDRAIAWEDVLERAEQPWPFVAGAPERLRLRSYMRFPFNGQRV